VRAKADPIAPLHLVPLVRVFSWRGPSFISGGLGNFSTMEKLKHAKTTANSKGAFAVLVPLQ
jgi:hypothetical protein